jgi:uncharacterized pyridoxamine 5'-phosphate oxidase family protein
VLATERSGLPYTNLIGYLLSEDFKFLYFFTPKNTMKYKNIEINPYVSILIDNRDKNSNKKFLITAVTVIGKASILKKFDSTIINEFLFYYPELTEFTKPGLNVLVKIDIDKYILVSKLQHVVEVKP